MALKIIGAGFGRTGTLSMKAALEQLGYNRTHHMLEVLPNPKQVKLWAEAIQGDPDWDTIFENYQACVDFPASAFTFELMAHYPDAKVLLNVRDPDTWYKSARDTIYKLSRTVPGWLPKLIPHARRAEIVTEQGIWQRVFGGKFEDEAYAKKVFTDHIDAVVNAVPKDKLLVFEVKQGWQPLCDFLDLPAPDTPFPHLNDTADFGKKIRAMKILRAAPWVLAVVVVPLIGFQLY